MSEPDTLKAFINFGVKNDPDHAGLEDAYEALVTAQNALTEAQEALTNTQDALALDERAEYDDRISALEEKIEDLSVELIKVKVIDISNYAVTMDTSFTYTGEASEPVVTVSGLNESAYKVFYHNNYQVGTGSVTIEGKSGYKGSITKYFTINPKKAGVAKVTPLKNAMRVKAKNKAIDTGASYYQIRYKMKGTSKWKSVTTKKQAVKIKNLKAGKRYQVQIRAYEIVNGDKFYGAWSGKKTSKKIR